MAIIMNLGTVNFGTNVYVADPSNTVFAEPHYVFSPTNIEEIWQQYKLEDVLPGSYKCSIKVQNAAPCLTPGDNGIAVAELCAVHEGYTINEEKLTLIKTVGMDSMFCGLFDAEYFLQQKCSRSWYEAICHAAAAQEEYTGSIYQNKCVVSCAGYEEGYSIFVQHNDKQHITAIRISYPVGEEKEEPLKEI